MKAADSERSSMSADEKRRLLARLLAERSQTWSGEHELSVGQRSLWALQQVSPGSSAYNFAYAFRINGAVDVAALRNAFSRIQQRHAVLRTTYPMRDGRAIACVARQRALDFVVVDAADWDDAQLRARIAAESTRPFDFAVDSMMRIRLFPRGPQSSVLLMVCHHVAIDFWSGMLILDELREFYTSERSGAAPNLPELTLEYRDFAAWQSGLANEDEGRELAEYWTRMLAGEVPILDMPTDFPRPKIAESKGAGLDFALPTELSRKIKDAARAANATPFVVLLAGFQALFARYSGQKDIWIGSPTAGRLRSGLQHVIGYFANPVVLRADLSSDPSFAELVEQQRVRVRGALKHQAMPFATLVDLLGVQREPSRSPLFDVMFTLQSVHRFAREGGLGRTEAGAESAAFGESKLRSSGSRIQLGELVLEAMAIPPCGSILDLDAEMVELHDAFTGRLTWNTALFEASTISLLVERFERLLDAATSDMSRPLSQLEIVSHDERSRIASWSAGRETKRSATMGVHHLFESSASSHPDAPAVISGDRKISFDELNRRAEQLAAVLKPASNIAVCCDRPLNGLLAILATLKAGSAYVPLSPRDPLERRVQMATDAGATTLLTDAQTAEGFDSIIRVDAAAPLDAAAHPRRTPIPISDDDLAYVMFTSGSSGKPKGVLIPHSCVVNHNRAAAALFDIRPNDRVLLLGPFGSDITVEQIFPTWLAGASLVVSDDYSAPSWDQLRRFVEEDGVTVLNVPTAYWHAWVRELTETGAHVPDGLRLVVIGGEAANRDRCDEWLRAGGDRVRLINTYGPTEATVIATAFEIEPAWLAANPRRRIPIGRPIDNVSVHVLDPHGRVAAIGVPGELYIGGAGVARGYLNAPELTAERFVGHAASNGDGGRMYRTGDRVRWRADGALEFLGRIDDQLKIAGYRIEPGEVEAALLACPGIKEATVTARDVGQGPKLIAYVVTTDSSPPDQRALRDALQRSLPDHLIPSIFVHIDAIPRLGMGKADRRALPDPSPADVAPCDAHVEPSTPAERTLAEIWRTVLNIPSVGIDDNFFSLGGDSILSIQVAARAAQAGVHVTPRQVFEHPTIAELARSASSSGVLAEQSALTGPAPLAPIQSWFFDTIREDVHHFNQAVLLAPRESIDPARLKRAVDKLLSHHDALRLRFEKASAGWRQEFASYHPAEVDEVFAVADLTKSSDGDLEAAIQDRMARAHASIDLAFGPLLRVVWFDTAGRRDRLLITIHHLAVDGVSWRILLGDLLLGYRQSEKPAPIQLPPKTSSFRAWTERLVRHAATDSAAAELGFWRRVVQSPSDALPRDITDGVNDVASTETIRVSLDAGQTSELLRDAPAAYGANIQELLLTALARTVTRRTGRHHLTLHVESHGRENLFNDIDHAQTVGWFTALYPLYIELQPDAGIGRAVAAVKLQHRETPNHGLGYNLLRYLRRDADLPAARCELSFNYLGQVDVKIPLDVPFAPVDEPLGPMIGGRVRRPHLIDVNAAVSDGRLQLAWTFSRNAHQRQTIDALAADYIAEVDQLVRDRRSEGLAARTPADFPLLKLDQLQLDRLLAEAGDIEDILPLTPLQTGLLMHSRFEPNPEVYFAQVTCTLRGDLDESLLRRAWQEAVNRHAALRTAFITEGLNEPVQLIHARAELPWHSEDLRGTAAKQQSAEVAAFRDAERSRGFDLRRPPLLRIGLFRIADDAWRLTASNHHLLFDGWSLAVLLREVAHAYESLRRAAEIPGEIRPRFAEYVRWLRERDEKVAEAFWRENLKGWDGAKPLSIEKRSARPSTGIARRGEVRRWISADAMHHLDAFARRERITLNTMVQAAWALLLSRYNDDSDIVFGATVSGRSAQIRDIESMVGLLINTVPVRINVEEGQRVGPWLRKVQALHTARQPFEHTALADVHRWSGLPGNVPLFDTLLVFENYPHALATGHGAGFGNLAVSEVERSLVHTNYGLMAVVVPGERMLMQVGFDARRFEHDAVERLLAHFERALLELTADADRPLSKLTLLESDERRRVLSTFNDTQREYALDRCVHELIADQTARTPDAAAVTFEGRSITYRELGERANQLAWRLIELGAGVGTPVGLYLERSTELVVAILAVLKAGAAYVPLDTEYPAARVSAMLEDVGAPIILTHAQPENPLPPTTAHIVQLDDWADFADYPHSEPEVSAGPEDIAYIIYTSGSTGRPNGAANTHRGLCNRLLWMQDQFRLTRNDHVLQKTPYGFDVSVWEFLWPLMVGARLVVARPGGHRDSRYLAETIEANDITTLHFVPSMLRAFLDELRPGRCRSLQRVICSGEALTPDLQSAFFERSPAELHNLYGPTEAAIDVTHWPCVRNDSLEFVPIGRPIANIRLYILDRAGRPTPVGVPGELVIAGIGVARGYVNRPELNARKFVPDPFVPAAGRMYRTGDRCRWLPDGVIEFLGRIDGQVKIRGQRVETGELETALRAHKNVADAAVIARSDNDSATRLVAYVVARGEVQLTTADLRAYLAAKIPDGMLPEAFVFLKKLPLTSSGKLDRRALPEPDAAAGQAEEYVAPRNELEQYLAELWKSILKVDRVGIHDGYFDLGGNSIQGAQIIYRMEQTFGVYVYVVALFDAPTVARLSAYLVRHHPDAVAMRFGQEVLGEYGTPESRATGTIDAAHVERFHRSILPTVSVAPPAARVPGNFAFVLSPPRSGSTLLRVMLGGHPGLFAPPELMLLNFDTMSQRAETLTGRDAFWLDGLIRTIMELHACGPDEAKSFLDKCTRDGWTTADIFRHMHERLAGRVLVDKTPPYALQQSVLRRAEAQFDAPRYIHLIRHPRGTIESFEHAKLHVLFSPLFSEPVDGGAREIGELFWVESHRNICAFLADIPADRQMQVRFEELVSKPEPVARRICEFLGIDFHPAILQPYADRKSRMTDGVTKESRMLGDVKFHEHGAINPAVADRWRANKAAIALGEPTSELAVQLGYERDAVVARTDAAPGGPFAGASTTELAQRAVLPADIRPSRAASPISAPANILLTGATGFLGAYLLRDLLDRSDARVHCLVRGNSDADAFDRLRAALDRYGIAAGADLTRVVPVRGDLARPRLGMSPADFVDLSASIDSVYHSGAWVNFVHPYDRLKAANVDGTIEVLRLAADGRPKTLHYVSTLAVFAAPAAGGRPTYTEDSPLDHGGTLFGGYSQTKWVAERLVRDAAERGLDVAIYRAGRISGDSRTGAAGADDLVRSLLKSCIALGAMPMLDGEVEITPVDYVARALVALSQRKPDGVNSWHLINPQTVNITTLLAAVRAAGHRIETVSVDTWMAALQKLLRETRDESILPLASLIPARIPPQFLMAALRRPQIDCRKTTESLRMAGVVCPGVDERLLTGYVESLLAKEPLGEHA